MRCNTEGGSEERKTMNNEQSEETSRLADCMQGETRTNGDRDFATMKSVKLGRGSETKQKGQTLGAEGVLLRE